jgi:hypothetical protein
MKVGVIRKRFAGLLGVARILYFIRIFIKPSPTATGPPHLLTRQILFTKKRLYAEPPRTLATSQP